MNEIDLALHHYCCISFGIDSCLVLIFQMLFELSKICLQANINLGDEAAVILGNGSLFDTDAGREDGGILLLQQ